MSGEPDSPFRAYGQPHLALSRATTRGTGKQGKDARTARSASDDRPNEKQGGWSFPPRMMRGEEIQMRKILHGILIALALLGGIAVASGHVETTATTCCTR